jgi:pteridine reductase
MRILITGAARRIGRITAECLAKQGHKIAIHYNNSDIEAMALLSKLGGTENGHIAIQADLNDINNASSLLQQLQPWGKPAILINNASTYHRRGLENFSNSELLDDYNVNFFSPFILMREFKKSCGYGSIINILDQRIDTVEPEAGPYAFAKKSLRDATEACAMEWKPQIRVNGIAPGPILLQHEDLEAAENKDSMKKFTAIIREFITSQETGQIKTV